MGKCEGEEKESVGEEIVKHWMIDLLFIEAHAHCFPEFKECIVWFIYTERNTLKKRKQESSIYFINFYPVPNEPINVGWKILASLWQHFLADSL